MGNCSNPLGLNSFIGLLFGDRTITLFCLLYIYNFITMKKYILISILSSFLFLWTVYWNSTNPSFMIDVNDLYPWTPVNNNTTLLDWFKYEIFIMMYSAELEKTTTWKRYKALIDDVLSNAPKDKDFLLLLNTKLQDTNRRFLEMPKEVDKTLEMILWYMHYKVLHDLYTLHWIDNLPFSSN